MTAPTQTSASAGATQSILYYARDAANLCTLAGLALAVLALYLALRGDIGNALVALLWAVNCDLVDGQIARRSAGRTAQHQLIGAQLDSLVDVVASGIVPGAVLLAMGDHQPWFLPGAVLLAVAAVLRLSYFNVYGSGSSRFRGLPVYYNPIAVAAAVVASSPLADETSAYVAYATIALLAALNLSSLQVPKQRGLGLWCLFGATVSLSVALVVSQ